MCDEGASGAWLVPVLLRVMRSRERERNGRCWCGFRMLRRIRHRRRLLLRLLLLLG
jgi:hypothetical protein